MNESRSLKDKRRVLQSLQERIRRSFNVAICEVKYQDQWQRARLAVALLNTDWRMIQSSISRILETVERDHRLNIIATETEQLC